MKIVFAIKSMNSFGGGAERVLADITDGLAERGHQISILTYDKPNGNSFYPLHKAIKRINLGIGRTQHSSNLSETIKRMIALRRTIKQTNPDIVVGFMHSLFLPLGISLIGTKIPVLASEHIGIDHYRYRPLERVLIQLTPLITKTIVVISKNIRNGFSPYLRKYMKIITNPVCIPVGIKKEKIIFDPNRKIILSIGRLVHQKDHKTLVEAFSRLAHDYPNWDLKIFGDGELRAQLETQVKMLKLEGRIQLLGIKQNIAEEYLVAHLYAVPSLYESFGLATAEALSYGLPAIGFADCPGTNELIRHEYNGILVYGSQRTSALADGLSLLMSSTSLRERLGSVGPGSMAKFSKENICSEWEELLKQCVEN
jgi:glycosyltransferase involved in cell wall biosynthesis